MVVDCALESAVVQLVAMGPGLAPGLPTNLLSQVVVLVAVQRRRLSIHKKCKKAFDCGSMQSKNQGTGCS